MPRGDAFAILLATGVVGCAAIAPAPASPIGYTTSAMPREIVMRHRTPQFNHVFSSDGYSAGYYSYLWADTLVADAWEAFADAGGPWSADLAARLGEHVFTQGNKRDPAEAYRAFRGKDPGTNALMVKRGFAKAASASTVAGTRSDGSRPP